MDTVLRLCTKSHFAGVSDLDKIRPQFPFTGQSKWIGNWDGKSLHGLHGMIEKSNNSSKNGKGDEIKWYRCQ